MKKAIKLLLMLVAMFTLAACGGSKEKAVDEKVTVWIPGDRSEYGFYYDMFDNYKAKLEADGKTFDFVIEQQPWGDYWTKLPLEVNNGRGPDLFLTHVAYIDMLSPISKEVNIEVSDIEKDYKVVDMYLGENGKPKFIPTVFVGRLMYANKDLWQETFGAGNTDYPQTWEELESASMKLSKDGQIGFNYSFHLLWDLAYQNGDTLTTSDASANITPEGLEMLKKWETIGVSDNLGFGDTTDSFMEGAAAIIYGEPWMEGWMNSSSDINFEAFPVPGEKGSVNTTYAAELSFGINKNATGERYEMLSDFVEFMVTDDNTMEAIARGNNGVSNKTSLATTMKYDEGHAGRVVTDVFLAEESVFVIPPSSLEEVYKNMLGDLIAKGSSVDEEIKNAEIAASRLKLERLSKMEERFKHLLKK